MSDELERPIPSREEAVNFTSDMRDAFDSFGDAASNALDFLRKSQEIDYWRGYGNDYSSWLDWYHTEMEDQLAYLAEIKIDMDVKAGLIQVLNDGGMTKKEIAETTGDSQSTVYRVLAKERERLSRDRSNEVDAAGQSVESVGHIDDDEPRTQTVATNQPIVINIAANTPEPNEDEKASLDNWLDTIDFGAMVIPVPDQQIIETDQSDDTPDYFTPRQPAPSWSPPQVQPLPPAKVEAYDDPQDNTPEFLGPPMTLQKAGAHNEDSEKHCKTCACNLLP